MDSASAPVALVGPTASGKSALAHELALDFEGAVELLSVDAMGVYRGMDLATAKPTRGERAAVTYHLIDLVDPDEEFTVAQFQRDACRVVHDLARRAHRGIYVGGTGLYARAVFDNLEIPGRYPEVRERLEARWRDEPGALFAQLREFDPVAASRLDATNSRRVLRALEVTVGAGRPFSSFGDGLARYGPVRVVQVGLDPGLDALDERIATRFHHWMDEGLIEEVARLVDSPNGVGRTARQAVGYKELFQHLEDGVPLEECVSNAITRSRRLARRQLSWFRRDPRVEWFVDPGAARDRVREVLGDAKAFVRD